MKHIHTTDNSMKADIIKAVKLETLICAVYITIFIIVVILESKGIIPSKTMVTFITISTLAQIAFTSLHRAKYAYVADEVKKLTYDDYKLRTKMMLINVAAIISIALVIIIFFISMFFSNGLINIGISEVGSIAIEVILLVIIDSLYLLRNALIIKKVHEIKQ